MPMCWRLNKNFSLNFSSLGCIIYLGYFILYVECDWILCGMSSTNSSADPIFCSPCQFFRSISQCSGIWSSWRWQFAFKHFSTAIRWYGSFLLQWRLWVIFVLAIVRLLINLSMALADFSTNWTLRIWVDI